MRFQKLKRNIAISLMIFVLVIGGILAVGFFQSRANYNSQLSLGAPIYTNRGGIIQAQPTQNTQANIQPAPAPAPPQQPTFGFFNSGIRTRAS